MLVHQNDPVVLLHNRRPAAHWVRVKLVGTQSNRDAVGAKVMQSSLTASWSAGFAAPAATCRISMCGSSFPPGMNRRWRSR